MEKRANFLNLVFALTTVSFCRQEPHEYERERTGNTFHPKIRSRIRTALVGLQVQISLGRRQRCHTLHAMAADAILGKIELPSRICRK